MLSPTQFQSTLPARGATLARTKPGADVGYFNPRSPHGERRRIATSFCATADNFNPRSPHGERHTNNVRLPRLLDNFNPRSPHGERQQEKELKQHGLRISIHAPRTGSDRGRRGIPPRPRHFNPRSPHGERLSSVYAIRTMLDFNPRSPHGERLLENAKKELAKKFQSTLPARGATQSHTSY